ncbi:cation transporter, partial [Alicyclobacillaceae bacterium I2511]
YLGLGMGGDDNLNVRSAVLHMLGDAAASAGVIVAAVVIGFTHWYILDPLLSVLIGLLVAFGAWRVVRQTLAILMEGTPQGVVMADVVEILRSVPGVKDVHDLHLWSISSGRNALSCHMVLNGSLTIRESQSILREVEQRLTGIGVGHITVQTEDDHHPHEDSVLCCDDFGVEVSPHHSHGQNSNYRQGPNDGQGHTELAQAPKQSVGQIRDHS